MILLAKPDPHRVVQLCTVVVQTLPNKLFELRELYRFDVSFNRLTLIDNFADLTALRYLDASHNEFEVVPLDLATSLTLLEHLDLSHNRISELPTYFGELRRLRRLNLAHNDIAEFPNDRMDVLASVKVRRGDFASAYAHRAMHVLPSARYRF